MDIKKTWRSGIAAGAMMLPFALMAQSAIDANELNGSDVRGTARFVAMGGAFTSLGGDLSSLSQNPAGLGLYRRSEIGLTFDVAKRNYSSETPGYNFHNSQTKANFDNFGYVGTVNLNSALKSFSWGVGYQRLNTFHSRHQGYNLPTETSLSNYIASYTTESPRELDFGENYNPYQDSGADWMSILGYTTAMINPTVNGQYAGLFQNNTVGDAEYTVEEAGYVDEYNIDFGGNVSDVVYWGVGIGIQDISYSRSVLYSESMENARIWSESAQTTVTGNAGFDIDSYKTISGTGVNLKFGVIVRPTDDFRVGFAIHTPTWYTLTHEGDAYANYSYYNPAMPESKTNPEAGRENTDLYSYNSRLNMPWRIMAGMSYTFGGKAILSVDYERVQYQDMRSKYQSYNNAWGPEYVTDTQVNDDIKSYFKGGDIIRAGLEYRVTPQFSVRAGYNYQTSHVREATEVRGASVVTAGTDASYTLGKDTGNLSFGLGYRYKMWYIDVAYQWKHQESTFHAYSDFEQYQAPQASFKDNIHSFVVSTGFKF